MKHLGQFIEGLLAKGRRAFTPSEAEEALGVSYGALKVSLYRLSKKREIVRVVRGLYLILTPEYRQMGCLPPDHLIPLLMAHLNIPYYVGVLSAAAYYGAAHQQPQVFQVVTSKQLRNIQCGKIKIKFIIKKNLASTPTQKVNVPTGYLTLSTAEATIMDLLCYPKQSGGLSRVVTVLEEVLIGNIIKQRLIKLIESTKETAWVQRLGYLLTNVLTQNLIRKQLIQCIKKYIKKRKPHFIPLQVGLSVKDCEKDFDWNVIVNTTVTMDEL